MTLRLYLIRHAQPASQEPGYDGGPNPPLGRKGRLQAERVGGQMKLWGVDAIYSSCMQRTLETARPIYEQTGAPWYVWPALSETDRRGWPRIRERLAAGRIAAERSAEAGLRLAHPNHIPLSALRERFGTFEADQPFPWPDEWWLPLEDETREQAYGRAEQALRHLVDRYRGTDARIAVVCHGALGSVLLSLLAGCPPVDHNTFSQAHAAISAADVLESHTQLRFVNYVGHLEPEDVTEGVDFSRPG
ncbi:histidine phosphatase family protein [Paenibacillus sp. GYB003]|uniref:histidine phosphatase family protein n=1 Tax=Paenibacillus sp. GYB003 TaxID=2994392 RepID=UPI002F96BFBA